ncbi:MAG: helix-turn-helix domain-containing protein [bacterium]|nr:helix-turn-helix domain-containing protein [bacterium]
MSEGGKSMDQIKIGKFIQEKRKLQNLTQQDLAEKLLITDRAVSKWECGKSLPDASIMLELCSILEISVNELLTGEDLDMNDYNKNAELNLIRITKQKEESDKRLLLSEYVLAIITILFLLAALGIVIFADMPLWAKITIGIVGFIQFVIAATVCFRIEQKAGYYECKHCHNKFVPTFKQVFFAPHMGRKRYMKCPNCGKKSYCKKTIIEKD